MFDGSSRKSRNRIAGSRELIRLPINLTSMSDVVQIKAALVAVEFVQDAIAANSQFEFRSALKALVREVPQSCTRPPCAALPREWVPEGNQMLWRTSATKSEARRPQTIMAAASCILRPRSRAGTGPAWLSLRWSAQDDPRGNHQSTRGFPQFPRATILESPLEFL
jgi:hypothetical protein